MTGRSRPAATRGTPGKKLVAGHFDKLGTVIDEDGVNFAVFSERAESVALCLFDAAGREVANLAFGEVDDLSNSGPFDTQEHYIGPTIYYTWGDDDEDSYVDDATDSGAQGKYSEFTLSFGMQFGLTKASSDMAAKVFVGYEFN